MTIHQLTVPIFTQLLDSLSAQLDKAAEHFAAQGRSEESLMEARLAPDMFPLGRQVHIVCSQVTSLLERLGGAAAAELPEVKTLTDAKALIADAIARLSSADAATLDAGAEKAIALELPNGMTFDLDGMQFVRDWIYPQFYFHAVTAYSIMRNAGVELGKGDFVRHMFAYMRQS